MPKSLHTLNSLLAPLCLGAVCCASVPTLASAQEPTPAKPPAQPAPVIGWIEIDPVPGKPDHVAIIGKVYGLRQCEGRYTLEMKRHERGNTSNSAQSGVFRTAQGETASLGRTTTNIPPASSLEIVLKLHAEGREIFIVTLKPGA